MPPTWLEQQCKWAHYPALNTHGTPDQAAYCTCDIASVVLQHSTWLIDPYWTLAPPLLAAFWLAHPAAKCCTARQLVSTALLLLWAVRLTHSYFRREQWRFGQREDWRYSDMKRHVGAWWPLVQVCASDMHAVSLSMPELVRAFSHEHVVPRPSTVLYDHQPASRWPTATL